MLASDLPMHTIKCCSVVFQHNVEASCHNHFVVVSREKQMLSPKSITAEYIALDS